MNRDDIPDDVRELLESERRESIRRANEIAGVLGMRELVQVDRNRPRWRSDDGEREPVEPCGTGSKR